MPSATSANAEFHHEPLLPQGRLWIGFAAAPVAWAIHGATSFFISWQACQDGTGDWGIFSEAEVRWLLGGITLGLLAVAMLAGAISYANWRRLPERRRLLKAEAPGREEYMAMLGVFMAVVFSVGIAWAGLGPVFTGVCVTAK